MTFSEPGVKQPHEIRPLARLVSQWITGFKELLDISIARQSHDVKRRE